MKSLFYCFILLFLFLFISCNKEDLNTKKIYNESLYVQKDTVFIIEDYRLVVDGSRSGIVQNGIFFESSFNWDNYFSNQDREHKIFNKNKANTIYFYRTSSGFANLMSGTGGPNILVANFDIVITFNDGTIEKFNALKRYTGQDEYTVVLSPGGLLALNHPSKILHFKRSKETAHSYLPYRGINNNSLWKWDLYIDGEYFNTELKTPENKNGNQWVPFHVH